MSDNIPPRIKKILRETQKQLQKIYHKRLKELILFGSYARGDFAEDSDIDIILLLDDIDNTFQEREKYLPEICKISLEYDKIISIIPFDYREFKQKRTPLILNVNKEGIRI